jgi:hypothetical protein
LISARGELYPQQKKFVLGTAGFLLSCPSLFDFGTRPPLLQFPLTNLSGMKPKRRGDSTVTAPVPNKSLELSNVAHGWYPDDDHLGKSNHVPLVFSSSPLVFVGSISAREIYYKETRFVFRTAGFFLFCAPSSQFREKKRPPLLQCSIGILPSRYFGVQWRSCNWENIVNERSIPM